MMKRQSNEEGGSEMEKASSVVGQQ
ncbi:uncharacterized protein G2W53_042660 [Senna tora]|uniref:Uncharacterized protein n=1 Tax=Senna tora TaxID=362788 RepID=A0A834SU89_9FABA|nr:uncharacterized protein G2W53_042660 [Senna tora]